MRENLDARRSRPGAIEAAGPRYCPSFEEKVVRFPDKERHQFFLEPEGWHTGEVYVQGFFTGMPEEVQLAMLHTIPALRQVEIMRPGYAIEYDSVPCQEVSTALETKRIEGLFHAGQINGTSGYEEAAAQGLIAGINAALKVQGRPPLILRRDQAYIGVLIDDLVTKEIDEPYRIMTCRAEYRLLLRQDNADLRLAELGYGTGLLSRQSVRGGRGQAPAVSGRAGPPGEPWLRPGDEQVSATACGARSARFDRRCQRPAVPPPAGGRL